MPNLTQKIRVFQSNESYTKIKRIGKGGYGSVYLVQRKASEELLILKEIDVNFLSEEEAKKADNENYKMEQFLKDSLGDLIYNKLKDICKIIIHGMEVEENVSFIYYYYNFCYMDTFLYISFVDKAIQENK